MDKYRVGVSQSSTLIVKKITVAIDDDENKVGVWIKSNNGSIYLPKSLIEHCKNVLG